MSPLFRKSAEKQAQAAAAQEEIDRLKALPIPDLAVQLLPALGPEGPGAGRSMRVQELCEYLLRDVLRPRQLQALQLMARTNDGLYKLEESGLVSSISVQRSPVWRITTDGEAALAAGTVREQLGPRPS